MANTDQSASNYNLSSQRKRKRLSDWEYES